MPLLWVIRDELGLTGTKYGCGLAQCGACSVMVDGVVTRSCVTPVEGMVGRKITTIEAIENDEIGKRVVAAWVKHQVPQCGYCQSGQVMAATALLKQTAHPTDEQIAAAMVNLCRCGTYNAIRDAVRESGGSAPSNTAAAIGNAKVAAVHPAPSVAAAATALAGIAVVSAIAKAKSETVEDGRDGHDEAC
ncbi:(2Fe-2S)-binding domain protein (plasmid) [Paraburkholderia phymatum STM815]|uniref:(2Fe-2S)-binding domain protein n=2 Tax=Paraburkholderia phymatum TaxID=148447 RepID=B2JTB6_PARP8|nr:(2Fe-2S)-binding domain protein [Paraburkholderia phymatum STM815]